MQNKIVNTRDTHVHGMGPLNPICFYSVLFDLFIGMVSFNLNSCLALELPPRDATPSPDVRENNHPMYRVVQLEKAFLRRCVQLSIEQEAELSSIALDVLKIESLNSNSQENSPERDGLPAVTDPLVDPNNALRSRQVFRRFEKAMANILTPSQRNTYQTEKEARDQFRRETQALGVALFFDQKLSFSIEQLKALQKDLAKWSGINDVHIEAYETTSSMIPVIRESILSAHLTRSQLDSLSNYRKIFISLDSARDDFLFSPILIAH